MTSISTLVVGKKLLHVIQFAHFHKLQLSSYELKTRSDYPTIILLHFLRIPNPTHSLCGRGKQAYYLWLKISCLYLWFDGHHFW